MNADPIQKSAKSGNPRKSVIQTKEGYKLTKLGWIPEDWDELHDSEIAEIKVGLLINFGSKSLEFRRLISSESRIEQIKR